MTKRSLILIAGLAGFAVLASACHGPLAACEVNEETGETWCGQRSTADQSGTASPTISDEPQTDFNQ